MSAKLAFVDPQSNHAFLKVDNTTNVPFNDKRNSVKITTTDAYNIGSVWVADIFHVPFGCAVWPAMWSWAEVVGAAWPAGGEIDTFEAVNQVQFSQIGLHTLQGCAQTNPQQSSTVVNTTDCHGDMGQGCIVTNAPQPSYGPNFAAAGGGVFVTEFATSAISVWFFPRANIPSSISSNASSIDTSSLGVPVGNWPASGCPGGFDNFFMPQNLVFHIVLCGTFGDGTYNQTCTPGDCYLNNVIGNGSNFADAFFEIGSVRVFSQNTTGLSLSSSSSASGTATSTLSTSASSASTGGSSSSAEQRFGVTQWRVVLVVALIITGISL
jgi:hypothetical protein